MASSSSNTEDSGVRYYPYRVTRSMSRQLASQSSQPASQSTSQSSQPASQSTSQSASTINSLLPSHPIREKGLYLSSAAIESAREKLLTFQKAREEGKEVKEVKEVKEEEEGYTGSREITIKENVSLKNYLRYRKNNVITSVRMYLHNGNVKIYEVPSYVHAKVAGRVIVLMGKWNDQDFEYGTDGTTTLGQNTDREPDTFIQPIHRPRPQQGTPAADDDGSPYPTMMVEVGYSQSLSDLHRTAALYFSQRTTIRIVLVIKIFGLRTNARTNTRSVALIAALYLRSSPTPLIPTSVVSFGTADTDGNIVNYILRIPNAGMGVPPNRFIGVGRPDPNNNNNNFPRCNMAGIPTYIMNIPGADLFDGVPQNLLPQGFAAGFNLDLWELQVVVRRFFNI